MGVTRACTAPIRERGRQVGAYAHDRPCRSGLGRGPGVVGAVGAICYGRV
jgi:hypothetical protein